MSRNSSKKDLGVFPHAELPPPVAAVIEAIETDIIRGIILPSTRLIEDHLMEDYDAKRHVVRAALVDAVQTADYEALGRAMSAVLEVAD